MFSICRFSQVVFIPQVQPRAQSHFRKYLTHNIESASALPIIQKERERERDGSDVTLVALKLAKSFALFLAKNLHLGIGEEFCTFPCQKFAPWYWRRVLHFSLPKICTLVLAKSFALFLAKNLLFVERRIQTGARARGRAPPPCENKIVRRPKPKKVLRSEVTLPPSVNKTIDSRLDRGKHFESNCTCWQGQTAADCEKETISRRSSSTVCTHSNNVVTGDRVGTPWGRHRANFTCKSCLPQLILSQFTHKSVPV